MVSRRAYTAPFMQETGSCMLTPAAARSFSHYARRRR
jgi:hypothetical protein